MVIIELHRDYSFDMTRFGIPWLMTWIYGIIDTEPRSPQDLC